MFAALVAALATVSCGATRATNEQGFVAYSECHGATVSVSLARPGGGAPRLLARGSSIDGRSVRIGEFGAFWKDDLAWREVRLAPSEAPRRPAPLAATEVAPGGAYRLRDGRFDVLYATSGDTTLLEARARRRGDVLEVEIVTSLGALANLVVHCASMPVDSRGVRRVVERHGGRTLKPGAQSWRAERRRLRRLCG